MNSLLQSSKIENHPLPLFLPHNAKILMLGSFPPPKMRWSIDFYYPNPQNDMWRIFGLIFFKNKDYFILPKGKKVIFDKEKIVDFLNGKGIALGDTAQKVVRLKNNASDNFLQIVERLNLPEMLAEMPNCKAIATTGQKATDTLLTVISAIEPKIGESSNFDFCNRRLMLFRMPSSSRAYPKPLGEKAAVYETMFRAVGLL